MRKNYVRGTRTVSPAKLREYPTWEMTTPEEWRFLEELEADVCQSNADFILIANWNESHGISGLLYLTSVGFKERVLDGKYDLVLSRQN